MKHLLTFSVILMLSSFTYIQAQDKAIDLKKFKDFKLLEISKLKIPGYLQKSELNIGSNALVSITNYNSIIMLPLDNMACLVPDVSVVSKMPNRQNTGTPIHIPNVFPQVK